MFTYTGIIINKGDSSGVRFQYSHIPLYGWWILRKDEMRPRYVNLIVELLKLSNPIDYGIKYSRAHIHGPACSRWRDSGLHVDLISTFTQYTWSLRNISVLMRQWPSDGDLEVTWSDGGVRGDPSRWRHLHYHYIANQRDNDVIIRTDHVQESALKHRRESEGGSTKLQTCLFYLIKLIQFDTISHEFSALNKETLMK